MKKKIITFLLCIFSTLIALSFGGCDLKSCLSSTPSTSKVRDMVSGKFNILLPENIILVNYSTEVGFDGGIWYCVFDYDGYDKEFNAILSDEKDEDFENKFKSKYEHAKNYFDKEYQSPDLTKNYSWIFDLEYSEDNRRIYHLLILYFPEEYQLIVIDDTLQNYDN